MRGIHSSYTRLVPAQLETIFRAPEFFVKSFSDERIEVRISQLPSLLFKFVRVALLKEWVVGSGQNVIRKVTDICVEL